MKMTMSQRILARNANKDRIEAGELIEARLDLVLGNDITSPVAIKEFNRLNNKKIFDKDKIALVLDHFTPNKDIKSAENCKIVREFARQYSIKHFYDVGNMGIEHALLPELGLVAPSQVIIGADSHTCTYGALGAFSTGVGSTDMAVGMQSGIAWFKTPSAIRVDVRGKLNKFVSGKDVILYLIGKIGVDGALYKSLEFTGESLKELSIDDRLTIANMAIEAGAKNGIFEVDEVTKNYLSDRNVRDYHIEKADIDAIYDDEIIIDLSKIKPIVALPHLPENTKFVEDIDRVYINQVVIGSCTNGRLSDLRQAASILKDKKVHKDVRCIVIPATQEVYLNALKEGLIEIFIKAGAIVSTPTCGPCLGGHMGILAKDEVCVATTNRNFIGRMGDITSKIYLSGPYVAANSAVQGYISTPDMEV